ncbi:hypothetical protein Afil01_54850 [Actinorhabdospora filicis]|uniref:Tetracyclin repressor-like C-terminal group 31 domain-containing protein n=1 Tax=Actinorhabdospora filicis TaxID=1785913 RepID=A0A9W6WC35_9ACTN|nr:hypothetical protein [Actinorhabdospora filicis]GLZ80678.1 hypothetical protein Afil01_54850 [Actinorhabdospora filicis]
MDAQAGLPQGSASNVFRTRDALVEGVLDRLLELETRTWRERKIAATREELETWALPWVSALGSARPREDLWTLLAVLDGLMTNRMAAPEGFFAPEEAIATVLRGMRP